MSRRLLMFQPRYELQTGANLYHGGRRPGCAAACAAAAPRLRGGRRGSSAAAANGCAAAVSRLRGDHQISSPESILSPLSGNFQAGAAYLTCVPGDGLAGPPGRP